ncbi:hypothetical protein QE152_g4766 [Popillia japonica]|uniref:Uncharacterized protein n=1 Tax=Popillia japonica TaxID=7064 RepID=A0AAW1N0P5_POPJA
MASEAYRTQKKELCKLIKIIKRKFWQEFCQELDNDVWRGAYRTVLKKLHCLAPYEVSIDQKRKIVMDPFPQTTDNWERKSVVEKIDPFSEMEVKEAADSIKSGKSVVEKIDPFSEMEVKSSLYRSILVFFDNRVRSHVSKVEVRISILLASESSSSWQQLRRSNFLRYHPPVRINFEYTHNVYISFP